MGTASILVSARASPVGRIASDPQTTRAPSSARTGRRRRCGITSGPLLAPLHALDARRPWRSLPALDRRPTHDEDGDGGERLDGNGRSLALDVSEPVVWNLDAELEGRGGERNRAVLKRDEGEGDRREDAERRIRRSAVLPLRPSRPELLVAIRRSPRLAERTTYGSVNASCDEREYSCKRVRLSTAKWLRRHVSRDQRVRGCATLCTGVKKT